MPGGAPPTSQHGDLLAHAEAAAVLQVHPITVAKLLRRGRLVPLRKGAARQLSRRRVEALAVALRPSKRTRSSYFIDTRDVAGLLGVSRERVLQLTRRGFLPAVETGLRRPVRLYRRSQIQVVANARRVRWTSGDRSGAPVS